MPAVYLCSYRLAASRDEGRAGSVPVTAGVSAAAVVRDVRVAGGGQLAQHMASGARGAQWTDCLCVALFLVQAPTPTRPGTSTEGRFYVVQAAVCKLGPALDAAASEAVPDPHMEWGGQSPLGGPVHPVLFLQPPTLPQAFQPEWRDSAIVRLHEGTLRSRRLSLLLLPLSTQPSEAVPPHAQLLSAVAALPTVAMCQHLNGACPSATCDAMLRASQYLLQGTASALAASAPGITAPSDSDGKGGIAPTPPLFILPLGQTLPAMGQRLRQGSPAARTGGGKEAGVTGTMVLSMAPPEASELRRIVGPAAMTLQHAVALVLHCAVGVQVSLAITQALTSGAASGMSMEQVAGEVGVTWAALAPLPLWVGSGSNLVASRAVAGALPKTQSPKASPRRGASQWWANTGPYHPRGGAGGATAPGTQAPCNPALALPARLGVKGRFSLAHGMGLQTPVGGAGQLSQEALWGALHPRAPRDVVAHALQAQAMDSVGMAALCDVHCLSTNHALVPAHVLDPVLSAGLVQPRPSSLYPAAALPVELRGQRANPHWARRLASCTEVVVHWWAGASPPVYRQEQLPRPTCPVCGQLCGSGLGLVAHFASSHEHLRAAVFQEAFLPSEGAVLGSRSNAGAVVPTRRLHLHISPSAADLVVVAAQTGPHVDWNKREAWALRGGGRGTKRRRSAANASLRSPKRTAAGSGASDARSPGPASAAPESGLPGDSRVLAPLQTAGGACEGVVGLAALPAVRLPACILPPTVEEAKTAAAEAPPNDGILDVVADSAVMLSKQFAFCARRCGMTGHQARRRHRKAAAAVRASLRGVAPLPRPARFTGPAAHLAAFNEENAAVGPGGAAWVTAASFLAGHSQQPHSMAGLASTTSSSGEAQGKVSGAAGEYPSSVVPVDGGSSVPAAAGRPKAAKGGRGDGAPFNAVLGPRTYYHSRTGQPVREWEEVVDSDDDTDGAWMVHASERLLDEFEDISLEEKELMKLWNRHVHDLGVVTGACRPSRACRRRPSSPPSLPLSQTAWCPGQSSPSPASMAPRLSCVGCAITCCCTSPHCGTLPCWTPAPFCMPCVLWTRMPLPWASPQAQRGTRSCCTL